LKKRISLAILCLACLASGPASAQSGAPIVTDSRIKTFVYNENDVFNVLTHYGYQSNVEFGRNEEVQTISVGDRVAWQIVPSGRRLFIRAMEENAHTNMTVVTNKRAYQFDLQASGDAPLTPSEELVYVIRFFYPDEQAIGERPVIYSDSAPARMSPASVHQTAAPEPAPAASMNYEYTYTGPSLLAPLKIYDDGHATYFKLRDPARKPQIAVIGPNGQEMQIPYSISPEGYAVVNGTGPRFSLRDEAGTVTVFNERHTQTM